MGLPRVLEPRTVILTFRVSPREAGLIAAAAARVPLAPGPWMRGVLVEAAREQLADARPAGGGNSARAAGAA